MHDAQTVGGGRCAEVVPIHQGHSQPAQGRVPRDAGALNAAPDDQNVVLYARQLFEISPHRAVSRARPAQACPELAEWACPELAEWACPELAE
jgi:hypothetical protein